MRYSLSELKILLRAIVLGEIKALVLTGSDYSMILEVNRLVKNTLNTEVIKIEFSKFSLNEIESQLMTSNLFNDRQIVRIENINKLIDLTKLLSIKSIHFPFLILSKIEKKDYINFDSLKDVGFIVCEYSDELRTKNIISKIFYKAKVKVDSVSLMYLTSCLKGLPYQHITNEMTKILNYLDDDLNLNICLTQKLLKASTPEANRNELCLHYAKNNNIEFLKQFEILSLEGFNSVSLIRSLIEYYINIYFVLITAKKHIDLKAAISRAPIYFKYQTDITLIIEQLSITKVAATLSILQKAESYCKLDYQNFDHYQHLIAPKLQLS